MMFKRSIAALVAGLLTSVPSFGNAAALRSSSTATLAAAADWKPADLCHDLLRLRLPHAEITSAKLNSSGTFIPPGSPTTAALTGLPQFCRVIGVSAPTSDSHIIFEVWVPTGPHWNKKFQQVGNGGFAGSIEYPELATGLTLGYAVAGTDDGHEASGLDGTWVLGHPQKLIDYAYRALKETTEKAKAIIVAYTGYTPRRSYFDGCSDGGREALEEAQRFPYDFDGIIVGSPANFLTHMITTFVWNERALLQSSASYIPPSQLVVLTNAALAQCLGKDGGVRSDAFLNDPRLCRFNPRVVQCKTGVARTACLSEAQVEAARKIYDGSQNPITHAQIFPGYEPGEEAYAANWPLWITGAAPGGSLDYIFGQQYFANFVLANPALPISAVNFTSDVTRADALDAPLLNSTNPDLTRFQAHGGKLIQYAGWGDAAIAPKNGLNYYNSVLLTSPSFNSDRDHGVQRLQSFYRVFMVPGMSHCNGGPGPNNFGNTFPVADRDHNIVTALDTWVERGIAPNRIVATKYVNDVPADGIAFERPLCVYPLVARYTGYGSSKRAENFTCTADKADKTAYSEDLIRAFRYVLTNWNILHNPPE